MAKIVHGNDEQLVSHFVGFERAVKQNDGLVHSTNSLGDSRKVRERRFREGEHQERALPCPNTNSVVLVWDGEVWAVRVVDIDSRIKFVLVVQCFDGGVLVPSCIPVLLFDVVGNLAVVGRVGQTVGSINEASTEKLLIDEPRILYRSTRDFSSFDNPRRPCMSGRTNQLRPSQAGSTRSVVSVCA
ncbi:hypothetical protein BCR44DRAFT_1443646 [Catenaria anguillulae PL171]|uniref:Uncharacterized protein n=1 Tax=Catenaria anguillulae PL171 TaxID=765915 RepID=A0A1Y2H8Q6_9FUNG|nr:hypothetical protein BCR44DRAFT_1443646 [Catenaria anguillulae PL171]